jgi:hypothetical protein
MEDCSRKGSETSLPALCITSDPLLGTRRVTVTVTVTQLSSIFPSTVTAGCNPQTRFATVVSGGFNDTQSPLGTPVTPIAWEAGELCDSFPGTRNRGLCARLSTKLAHCWGRV